MLRRLLLIGLGFGLSLANAGQAQELVTSTPVRISIPTGAAPEVEILSTPTITRTPTQSAVMIEAKAEAGEINVRAEADIESELLGTIRAGEFYPVLGRYFRWIQFQFDVSPSGRGWVFDELVNISGDASSIPDLSQAPLPTEDPFAAAATQTQAAITTTPGGLLTVTAQSRVIDVPLNQENNSAAPNQDTAELLPTFTFPPDIVAQAPTAVLATSTPTLTPDGLPLTGSDEVPPILPILLLAGGGLLGLLVSWLRR
jgi:hypothetical protein